LVPAVPYPQAGWPEIKYLVIYERSPTGWGAYVPDLPGLGVVAKALDEAKVRETIEFHLEVASGTLVAVW
jgi:predicted RNase H-like HicB family nuclease